MPDSLDDAQFDTMFGPSKPAAAAPPTPSTTGEINDADFINTFGPDSKTQTNTIMYGDAAPFISKMTQRWQAGDAGIARGVAGMRAIQGAVQYEDIKDQASNENLARSQNPVQENLSPWDVQNWVGNAVESLPFMLENAKGAAKGGVAGAAIGASTAAIAGQLGPQVALPEEIATVPAGAAFGWTWGTRVGAFTTSSKIMAGQLYLDLRDKGINHETAKTIGFAGGAVEGLIEAAELGTLTSAGRKAFVQQLGTQSGKNALFGFLGEYAKDVGTEVTEEELQSVTELLSRGLASYVDKNPNAAPTGDEIRDNLLQTFQQSLQASTLLVGGSRIAGASAGAGANAIHSISSQLLRQQQVADAVETTHGVQRGAEVATGLAQRLASGRMTVEKAMGLIAEGLNNEQPTEAQRQEAAAIPVSDILDALTMPATDNDQKPLQASVRVMQQIGEGLQQSQNETSTHDQILENLNNEKVLAEQYSGEFTPESEKLFDDNALERKLLKQKYVDEKLKGLYDSGIAGTVLSEKRKLGPYSIKNGHIDLIFTDTNGDGNAFDVDAYEGGEPVGHVDFANISGKWVADGAHVFDGQKRRGIATAIYNAVEHQTGAKLLDHKGIARSEDAQAFWASHRQNVNRGLDARIFTAAAEAENGTIYADGPETGNPVSLPDTELPTPELQARARQVDSNINDLDKQIRETQKLHDARDLPGRTEAVQQAQIEYEQARERAERLEKKFSGKDAKGTDTQAVLDKLEHAYAQEKTALKALKKAQRELASINPKQTATGALTNKLERLYQQRSTLETERALLSEGLLSVDEIKKSPVKMTAGQVTSLRAKAVSKILKAYKQGHKEGVRLTRGDIHSIQNEVTSLIRESELSGNDKGKFLGTIQNIQTESQLQRALPKIQARVDKLVETDARRDIKKQLKKLFDKAKLQTNGKRAIGKFGNADLQFVLDSYKKAIQSPAWRNEAIARHINFIKADIDEQQKALENGLVQVLDGRDLGSRESLETAIAQQVGQFEDKSVEDQQAIVNEIERIIMVGDINKLEQKMADAQHRAQQISDALVSIQGNKPLSTLKPENSALSIDKPTAKFNRLMKTLNRTRSSWDGLMGILSQNDPNNNLKETAEVYSIIRDEIANQRKYRENLIGNLIHSVGKNKRVVLDRVVSGSKKENIGQYTDQDGELVDLIISRNEAIKLWNQMRDPDLKAGLQEGNLYTFPEDTVSKSTHELLEGYLSNDDKAIADGLLEFYRQYFDRINKEWEDETGASLERNNDYSGYAKRRGTPENGSSAFFHEQFSRSSIKPSSTISRVANTRGLDLSDAIVDALKHTQDFEHWIAWRKREKVLRGIFGNPEIRSAIKLKYGDGMMRTVDDRFNDMVGTRQEQQADALKFLDHIRTKAGTAFVGGKVNTFFQQLSAIVNFMVHIGPVEMADGLIDFALHPKRAIATMEQSPLLQNRVETFDRDLMEALTRDDIQSLKRRPKMLDMMLWFTKYGDRVSVWAGGWGVYKSTLKQTGDPHKAMLAFEKAFQTTQQSGTPDQLSQLERSGPFGKIMTVFLKQQLQMIELEVEGLRKAANHPSPKNISDAVRRIAVIHTSSALFQAIGSGFTLAAGGSDDPDLEALKVLRALLIGPFNGIPILGDTITSAATGVTNWAFDKKEQVWKPKFLPYDAAGKLYDLMKHTFDAIVDDEQDGITLEELLKIISDYDRSLDLVMPAKLGGGVPKEPLVKSLKWLFVEDQPKGKH